MKYIENKLGRQLLVIQVITFDIILITILFLLPNMLKPIYETGIYNSLKSPIDMLDKNLEGSNISREVAYVYVTDDNIYTSKNYNKIVSIDKETLLSKIEKEFGNFKFKGKLY